MSVSLPVPNRPCISLLNLISGLDQRQEDLALRWPGLPALAAAAACPPGSADRPAGGSSCGRRRRPAGPRGRRRHGLGDGSAAGSIVYCVGMMPLADGLACRRPGCLAVVKEDLARAGDVEIAGQLLVDDVLALDLLLLQERLDRPAGPGVDPAAVDLAADAATLPTQSIRAICGFGSGSARPSSSAAAGLWPPGGDGSKAMGWSMIDLKSLADEPASVSSVSRADVAEELGPGDGPAVGVG